MNPLSLLPPPPPSTNFFNDPHTTTTTVETSLARRRTRPRLHDPRAPPPPVPLLHLEILSSLSSTPPHAANTRHGARFFSSSSAFIFLPFPLSSFFFFPTSIFLPTFLPSPPRERCCRAQKAISRVITASIATSVTRRTELHFACRPPPLLILLPLFVNTSSSSLFGCCNRYQRDVFIIVERSLIVELFQLDVSRRHAEYEERSSPLFRERVKSALY